MHREEDCIFFLFFHFFCDFFVFSSFAMYCE
jgi:hypothetical protein